MKFSFNPNGFRKIQAADEGKPAIEEAVEEAMDNLSEDFDYAVSGLEKLYREGEYQQALAIIDSVSTAINDAIAQIGDSIGEDTPEE